MSFFGENLFEIGKHVRIYFPADHRHLCEGKVHSYYSEWAVWVQLDDTHEPLVLVSTSHLQPINGKEQSFIVSGSSPKPRKEWQPDEISPDVDVMDVTRGLIG